MTRKLLAAFLALCMTMTLTPFAFAATTTDQGETGTNTNGTDINVGGGYSGSDIAGNSNDDPPGGVSLLSTTSTTVVAKIGEVGYTTLKEAFTKVQDGETIVMQEDTKVTASLVLSEGVSATLDLNGKALTGKLSKGIIDIKGTLTVIDSVGNGKIASEKGVVSNPSIRVEESGKLVAKDVIIQKYILSYGDLTLTKGTFGDVKMYGSEKVPTLIVGSEGSENSDVTFAGALTMDVSKGKLNLYLYNGTINGKLPDYADVQTNLMVCNTLFVQSNSSNQCDLTEAPVEYNGKIYYQYTRTDELQGAKAIITDDIGKEHKFTNTSVAISKASDGSTIKLLDDTSVGNVTLSLKKNLIFDLNGHTVTGSASNGVLAVQTSDSASPKISVTIKNGKIIDTATNEFYAVHLYKNADVVMEDVIIEAQNVAKGISMGRTDDSAQPILTIKGNTQISAKVAGIALTPKTGTTAKLTVENGTIVGGNYGIAGKGDCGDTEIMITGGTIRATNADGAAIYHPENGKLTITGGTLTGAAGVQMCAGELSVSGDAVITATGDGDVSKAGDSGSIPDGAAVSIVNRAYPGGIPSATIDSGYFKAANGVKAVQTYTWSNKTKTDTTTGLSVTGGYYTSDPSSYVVTTAENPKVALPGTYVANGTTYSYKVDAPLPTNVEVAAGKTEATAPESVEKAVVESVSKTTVTGVTEEANEVANKLSENDKATKDSFDAAASTTNSSIPMATGDVTTIVAPRLDITINSCDSTAKTLDLDITAVYDIKATTADDTAKMVEFNGSNAAAVNTVTIQKNAGTLDTTGTDVEITIPLPANFVNDTKTPVYITHTKANGTKYVYKATVTKTGEEGSETYYATFTNPNGFSNFVLKTQVAASITANDKTTYYDTLQDAVDAVQDGETITVTGTDLSATVSGNKTFKVEGDANLTAASGYTLTQNDDGSYTVSRKPSSGSSGSSVTTYAVNVTTATNGTVTADKKTAAKGATVTVTATPSAGYVVESVKVVDKDGKTVDVTAKDGKYSFVMPASAVTVTATFKAEAPAPSGLPFTDVKEGDWFYGAVKYAYENGLMNGTGETIFAPNGTMNRAMIVTVLYRLEKSPAVTTASQFKDVPAGQWYSDAVAWAAANNIVNGYDETTFGPMNAVTREQMAAILFRYEQYKGMDTVTLEDNLAKFPDKDKISGYAVPALNWAVGQKVINGNADGTLDPTGTATRAQVAQILTNLLNK